MKRYTTDIDAASVYMMLDMQEVASFLPGVTLSVPWLKQAKIQSLLRTTWPSSHQWPLCFTGHKVAII